MRCHDCGVNLGSLVLMDGKKIRLCQSCGESAINEGHAIEGYDEAWEREQDRRADEALADR